MVAIKPITLIVSNLLTVSISAGMLGSPMFTKVLHHGSFVQAFAYAKLSPTSPKLVTIMGWLRPDAVDEGNVLVIHQP